MRYCEYCNYTAKCPSYWYKHQKTKKHLVNMMKVNGTTEEQTRSSPEENAENAVLAKLIKENKKQQEEINKLNNELSEYKGQVDNLDVRINKLEEICRVCTNSPPLMESSGVPPPQKEEMVEIVPSVPVSIARYGDEEFVADRYYNDILYGVNTALSNLIIDRHFNPKFPRNKNLKVGKKTTEYFDGNEWITENTEVVFAKTLENIMTELKKEGYVDTYMKARNNNQRDKEADYFVSYKRMKISKSHMKNVIEQVVARSKRLI